MKYDALFLGSIGVVADTSDLQRRAFNHAFERFGLGWHWGWDTYAELLKQTSGRARIADYAETLGESDSVDPGAVYAVKQGAFDALVSGARLRARPGVVDLLAAARAAKTRCAFVSTTTPRQIATTFRAVGSEVQEAQFDYISSGEDVAHLKPAPDCYLRALDQLGLKAENVLAVEDTPESAQAAITAGITVIAFPGRAAYGRPFPAGVPVMECLTPGLLQMPRQTVAAE
ncbi:MAG: HAD-IA family hydrolase [Pseudomonadota bacterium]